MLLVVAVVGASVCIFVVPEINPEAEQCRMTPSWGGHSDLKRVIQFHVEYGYGSHELRHMCTSYLTP